MAPQNFLQYSPIEKSDYSLVPDEQQYHHHHVNEERGFQFNPKSVLKDLINLDYSKVVWRNVILFAYLHVLSVYGIYLCLFHSKWTTVIFAYFLYYFSATGITMGAHRLWTHRSYKANLPLRIILAVWQSLAFQNSIFEWSRDHRVHHKYSETDADPHNAQRGFFFCHMGWLMYKKHPEVIEKGKNLDMSDLLADPVVRIQKRFYLQSVVIICFLLPTIIPWYFWGENIVTSFIICAITRYCWTLHVTWMVNSLAHWIGMKPYDKEIHASENKLVSTLALGEGWHNFHHVFPFDYRAAELRGFMNLNITTDLIELFAKIGWAYDLKVASPELINERAKRTGDGSHHSTKTK